MLVSNAKLLTQKYWHSSMMLMVYKWTNDTRSLHKLTVSIHIQFIWWHNDDMNQLHHPRWLDGGGVSPYQQYGLNLYEKQYICGVNVCYLSICGLSATQYFFVSREKFDYKPIFFLLEFLRKLVRRTRQQRRKMGFGMKFNVIFLKLIWEFDINQLCQLGIEY